MATRSITQRGDEILTKVCRPVERFDKKLETLLADMAQTMYKADGVGLAGPQVGMLRRLFVVDIGQGLIEAVNPEIRERSGADQGLEGCLSCPDIMALVTRPTRVVLHACDRFGREYDLEAEGFLARAICHEYDHLDGKTIYETGDRLLTREQAQRYLEEQQ